MRTPRCSASFGFVIPHVIAASLAAAHKTCFPCHEARVKDRDFVFTRCAP
jgi:hypothetical protein